MLKPPTAPAKVTTAQGALVTTDSLPSEPATGRGRRHGTSSSEPFDRWFRYPAGFATDYVSVLLQHLDLAPGSLVVDPFAGSAVTGTAARAEFLSFFGIEAHPLIAELGQLKLQKPPGGSEEMIKFADALMGKARRLATSMSEAGELETELVQRCFTPKVLSDLVALRELIRSNISDPWAKYLKWALLATLRDVASVRVGWPYQRPGNDRRPRHSDTFVRFRQRVAWMAADINKIKFSDKTDHYGQIINGDARDQQIWNTLPESGAHGCVSSPPYLNNFDYADATRLELYFWGEVRSWSGMCRVVRSSMLTATTQQSSMMEASEATATLQNFGSAGDIINELTERLMVERRKRERGKEYDRVIPAYFAAMAKVLDNLAAHLTFGAPVVWLIGDSAPYGIYVNTPSLIASLAAVKGLSCEKDIILRHRGNRWATNGTRHSVALAERLLLMRRR